MKKTLLFYVIGILIFFLLVFGIIIIKKNEDNKYSKSILSQDGQNDIITNSIEILSTASEKIKTTPNTELIFETHYKKCNHINIKKEVIDSNLVNLSQEEFYEKYKLWELVEFTSNKIYLKREDNGICNEHYVLREKDGYIAVYLQDENEKEVLIQMTGIVTKYLPEADIIQLNKGIKVVGNGALNSAIEDYE